MRRAGIHPGRLARIAPFACLLLASACGSDPDSREPRPNVLLVTIDTLRADHLSLYGYERPTTPFLEALAADAVRFDRAYSTSSWTVPAMVSLFSGVHPDAHRVVHGTAQPDGVALQEVVPEDAVLWTEVLSDAGYHSFAVTTNFHLASELGFGQGFERFWNGGWDASAEQVNRRVEHWLEEIRESRPYFLWVHYLDPHLPYTPREPWISAYDPGYADQGPRVAPDALDRELRALHIRRDSPELAYLTAAYDAEINYTDAALRELFAWLRPSRHDLVVIASDHGEELLDHGRFGHQLTLFEEATRVPLLMLLPGRAAAGQVVSTPVSLVDVLPTVLDTLGLPAPAGIQGRSLRMLIEGKQMADRDAHASLAKQRAIRRGRWKLIRNDARRWLFDLERDPRERRNVAGERPDVVRELDAAVTEFAEQAGRQRWEVEFRVTSEDEAEQLRALGYLE